MFKLTSKLALSNLKQNRKLYYPFALAVILTTMILYSFIALSLTPHLEDSYGGGSARTVLGFGSFVVQLVVIILVAYANGYVCLLYTSGSFSSHPAKGKDPCCKNSIQDLG